MSDLWWPDVRTQKVAPRIIDSTARFNSPFTGVTRTVSRGGDRWAFALTYNDLAAIERARLENVLAYLRGGANRAIYTPPEFQRRGSFPAGELYPNADFSNGITGWTAQASMSVSPIDRGVRATRTLYDGTANSTVAPLQSVTLAQYVPYLIRFFAHQGRGVAGGVMVNNTAAADSLTGTGVFIGTAQAASFGPLDVVRVPLTAGAYSFGCYSGTASGGLAGDYYDVYQGSCTQCAVVDALVNALLNSDDFSNASWTKTRSSVTANATTAPDGTSGGDQLTEDSTASATHVVGQAWTIPSAANEYVFTVAAKANSRSWLQVGMIESTGGTSASCYFNLGSGVLGTAAAGANWTNVRAFITPLGNGWYQCTVVARKTSAGTTLTCNLNLATADLTNSYTGNGSSNLYVYRGTSSQSSFPTQLVASAGSQVAGTPSGSSIYVKGLPVSSTGLVLPGDWFELNKELKRVTNMLSSDAQGCGYLQFSPPIRTAPADEDPVIINNPAGRFILSASENGWESSPGGLIVGPRASYSLDIVEAP